MGNNTILKWVAGIAALLGATGTPIYRAITWSIKLDTRVEMLEEKLAVTEKKLEEEKEKGRDRREQIHQELHKVHGD